MTRNLDPLLTRSLLAGWVGLTALCVSACGGGAGDAVAAAAAVAGAVQAAPLAADGGAVPRADAVTVPSDAGARTRSGRYATAAQAEQMERALEGAVIRVDIACCGIDAAEQAVGIAYGLQAAADLPDSTPVLVRAADLRLGAAIVNRLSDAGYTRVWLVLP